jgi:exosortase E/protease (VPEID-CTERM system)
MPNSDVASSRSLALPFTFRQLRRVARATLLSLLLAAELSHLGIPLLSNLNPTLHGSWWAIIWNGRPIAEAVIGGTLVAIFLSWPIFRAALVMAIHEADSARLNFWLGVHLTCVVIVTVWLACGLQGGNFTAVGATVWFLTGLAFLPLTAITWSAAIVPPIFWKRWLLGSPIVFIMGAIVGVVGRSAGYFAQLLWPPLRHYTFVSVDLMLRALGLAVVSDSSQALIGTAHFAVRIAPTCSGLEGIALICVFAASYLWVYRTEYNFPAALLLIPAGIASIWVLNAVRITVLILIGQWYSQVAVTGFHTVAGWIFFNLTAFGIVSVSRHVRWLARTGGEAVRTSNPAVPYLMPLLLALAATMLTAPFAGVFDAVYLLRVIVVAVAVWCYRDRIGTALAEFSWTSAGLGALCFLLWAVLRHHDRTADAVIAGHLRSLPIAAMAGWLLFRVAGAAITAPVAEELAFRGYLQRKLVASDFESVPFDRFTWRSFIISSLAFGALHQSWVAGTLAGALFALAMYRRGRLADAIATHAIANTFLAIYIIANGYWSLWN